MRKILFSILTVLCFVQIAKAQPATYSNPLGLGRNNCGTGSNDSLYYLNYLTPNLTNSSTPITACKPVLRTNFAPLSGYSAANKPFTIFNSSIAFNPADGMIYYVWTDYNIPAPYKSYIWRWNPSTCPTPAAPGLDTLRTFNTDIGGITFDANGTAWQLEFSGSAPYQGRLRQVNFTTGVVGIPDTLDLTGGKQLWNVGTGDITLTPSGQMYFIFNNKLFTPDYGSAGGPTKHIKCTYIDTVKLPAGKTGLPGLAFGSGDLIASYSPGTGCVFKRIDPITGDTASITYTYAAGKGIYATDMTQINSGIGPSKKLISVTPTGTPGQYDVVYDVYTRNYGNVPLTNVQVKDSLGAINGNANVSNVTAVLTSNPAGVALNPGYNGTTNINLLAAGQGLACYPVANNNFTIRISCRLSNLLNGVVYNNSAIASANGYKNVALRDSSTNGSNPDLNQNDKTDDLGEGQPTPLIIILTPTTPPCATLDTTLYNQDFGSGAGLFNTIPPSVAVPSASSTYIGTAAAPLPINRFTVTNNSSLGDASNWISLTDHTGGANGRMLVVNADASANIMYRDTLPVSCSGQQYSVSFWAAFIGNAAYKTVCDGLGGFKYPMLLVRIRDLATGLVITQYTTDTIKLTSWQQHGMKWVMPAGYTNVILELLNAGPGGCGNDVAIDDIKYGICDPVPTVSLSNPGGTCLGSSLTFTANVSDASVIPGPKDYQWQWSPSPGTGPWTNIGGANASTYIINPVNPSDTGRYYRVIMAAQGNIGNITCQYISPGVRLIGVAPSTAPSSITAPSTTICNGSSVTLTAVGATLGTGANYQWGTGAVVGTSPIGGATSSTLLVSPTTTTTYWVRVENTTSPCLTTTGGVTLTVTVNQPSVAPASISGLDICNGSSTTLTAVGGTLGTGANYQWGTGAVVGTSPIGGATSSTLLVSPSSTTTYWVRIENNVAPCTATTTGVTKLITVSQPSVAAASASKSKNNICPGISVNLSVVGGTLGTNASWKWYTGSCGTSLVGTGSGISVTPAVTTTYYVRAEGDCNTTTCVAVTVNISCDIDKDKDGIPDWVESNMTASFQDANGNGVINAYDPTYAGFVDNNNDYINDNFQADGDSDNDGIPNYLDTTFPGRVDVNGDGIDDRFDTDLDGVINMLDLDSDNDGIPDVVEAYGVDTDGDGKIDNFADSDGDGLTDQIDGNNLNAYNSGLGLSRPDIDGDGIPNYIDLDSDNDGIPDVVEAGGPDANNNGIIDGFVDANGDGLHDGYINATALLKTGTDGNADGRADSWPNQNLDRDLRPNAYDMDSDGDGIVDVIEAGLPDANLNGIVDGVIGANGWSTTISSMPALNLRNTDGNGNPDYLDIDSDDDGIPDNIEGMSTAGYLLPGITDTDGDGLVNTYDNIVGFGGAGIFVYDHDGDGIPDYRDLDSDGDGQPDVIEGNDFNLNNIADDNVTLTGLDTDGDGLDNRFDSLNSVTNIKGTSYMMGNGGSLTGDATPGSRCTVQKKTPAQLNRDWRFVGTVLPVEFLQLTGVLQSGNVRLNWVVIATKEVDRFEVERSTDNVNYIKTGTVSDLVKLNEQQGFTFNDDVSNVNKEIIYYRIKVIGKAGEIQYSNVLVIRMRQAKTLLTIMPNPARDNVMLIFFAEKDSDIMIRLVDNLGQTVMTQRQKVLRGNNTLQLKNLDKYSAGVYVIQVLINDELVSQKLIISR
ncbi:MAG: T9SS type A sorting domain-containing protein [Chitinophagaceae bacterium]|nr:T9SS type A sorting domain-containing protein [Chitinophagaceae bacterium]